MSSTSATERNRIYVALVGHVDHGKSTVIGRLLHDMGALPDRKTDEIREHCARRGMAFEWSFITDALQAERRQGVTIDAGYIRLTSPAHDTVLIDAPGHREFIRNMISGASASDAALLVIDAQEGIGEQTRRHAYLLHLLGIRQVAVVINKMDLVERDQVEYQALTAALTRYLGKIGLAPMAFIPTVAPEGENIVVRAATMPWYSGPTVAEALSEFSPQLDFSSRPLRLRVQDVYRFNERRIIAGRIDAGRIKAGDLITVSPSNQEAYVEGFEAWGGPAPREAEAGQSVGLTLDRPLFVERGDLISHGNHLPFETNLFTARIFWLSEKPLVPGQEMTIRLGTCEARGRVQSIEHVIDLDAGAPREATKVARHELAEVAIQTRAIQALDAYETDPVSGRVMLMSGYEVVGGGTVVLDGCMDQRPKYNPATKNVFVASHRVTSEERAECNNCTGTVFWLTGLPGAGKSTIAMGAEQALFRLGYPVYALDGDNLRHGLNSDLTFTTEDRDENIRRAGEVAALFADAGMVVITAFISPYQNERSKVRAMVPRGRFHEIYVDASLESCERRDPKGLYRKARRGEIGNFTGISAPYEPPLQPELILNTDHLSAEDAIRVLVDYIREHTKI